MHEVPLVLSAFTHLWNPIGLSALWAQGIRTELESGKKRHEFQTDHGFRKWYKTQCEMAGMKPINIEKLTRHSVGISDSY